MKAVRLWPDGLGGQIALLLFAALLVEFVGSEWLFRRIETNMIARERAGHLAQQIAVADRLMAGTPAAERPALAEELWLPPLSLSWHAAPPAMAAQSDLAATAKQLQTFQPQLQSGPIQLSSKGSTLSGAWQLDDGSWMSFRADGYLDTSLPLRGHAGPVLLLVAVITLLALVLARLIGLPLRKLADAADRVGHEEVTAVAEEGPREVRRVAAAFNAMQARLLEQVNERIQSLAAVSHDLRTPIARLRLRAASIPSRSLRTSIDHDLDEMEAFMRSLLDYLRGADPEEASLIDLASMIVTIVHDAQDMGSDVSYQGPASLEMITRPLKLQRVIDNLVQNAIRHAGQAEVGLSRQGNAVRIVVQDQGPGIPESEMEAVFEPFRRLEGSRNRNSGGAGLGLAIVRRSIQRLGGSIRLDNRPEGGLRATILLG